MRVGDFGFGVGGGGNGLYTGGVCFYVLGVGGGLSGLFHYTLLTCSQNKKSRGFGNGIENLIGKIYMSTPF